MSEVEVVVSLDSAAVLAGRLHAHRRRATESATFYYDEAYLARPDAYALDPALPLVAGALHTPVGLRLFNAFRDSAPDRWGRDLIMRREQQRASSTGASPRTLSEFDFLLGVRDDLRQGALRFRDPQSRNYLESDDVGIPTVTDLPELLDIAARVETDTAAAAEVQRLVRAGSSLGGARPKTHIIAPDGRIAIAKFPSASVDTWNVMAWEYVALRLAADAGLVVPHSELINVARRSVLIVDRFDRAPVGQRIGYASALTMLEAREGDQRSYLDIAEIIEERSPHATDDLRQLWRRMVFYVMISNTDDHLRNHAFLHAGSGAWSLSPAFDINPDPTPGPKYLNTAINETQTEARVDLLLEVAPYFRLDQDGATDVIARVERTVGRWRTVARHAGLSTSDANAMEPAFEHTAIEDARALTQG
jgi:serine/threonine-protein kinase HipA